jgi:hypothetical protein
MTIRKLAAAAVIAAAHRAACLANAQTTAPSELELLKAQLAVLQQRLEQLEAAQQAQTARVNEVKVAQETVNTELQDLDRPYLRQPRARGGRGGKLRLDGSLGLEGRPAGAQREHRSGSDRHGPQPQSLPPAGRRAGAGQ